MGRMSVSYEPVKRFKTRLSVRITSRTRLKLRVKTSKCRDNVKV